MASTAAPKHRALAAGDCIDGIYIELKNGRTWSGEFWTTVGKGDLARFLGSSDRSQITYVFLGIAGDETGDEVAMATPDQIFALDGYR
jgi:hypothetical protein